MWSLRSRALLHPSAVLFTLLTWVPVARSLAGTELFFDGSDDYASAFPGFDLLSEWTIEAWVRPSNLVKPASCLIGLQTTSARNLLTITTTSDAAWRVIFGGQQEIPSKAWVNTGYQPGSFAAAPHHFALTHTVVSVQSSSLQFYLNGTLQATWFVQKDDLRARPETALPTLLGACHQAGVGSGEGAGRGIFRTSFFSGSMDEVRLWTKVRTQAEIQQTMPWTGPASLWPTPGGTSLRAQYSCDVTTRKLHDGSIHGMHGWLGTVGDEMNSPSYAASSFNNQLSYGPTYLQLRVAVAHLVQLTTQIFSQTISYNAILVVQAPSHNNTQLRLPGDLTSQPLITGALVSSLSFDVLANTTVINDSFAIRPCRGLPAQPPAVSFCTDPIQNFTISTTASTPPVAGPSYGLQLLRYGAYVKLPPMSNPTTFEAWLQLTPPLRRGATIFSVSEKRQSQSSTEREIIRWWLDPHSGGGVLDFCTVGGGTRLVVPGVASMDAQHLALSFEMVGGTSWNYSVKVHRNCHLVLQATIPQTCVRLDSAKLRQPTIGQQYVPDEPGAVGAQEPRSTSFAPMYLAEMRLWNVTRSHASLCAHMSERLHGNETGLMAYFPVLAADVASTSSRESFLQNKALPDYMAQSFSFPNVAKIMCAVDYAACPNFASSVGFAIRHSPFNLPPEVVTLDTTARSTLSVNMVAHDPDNYQDNVLASSGVDTVRYEILEVPWPVCGYIYEKGQTVRILDGASRVSFGLSATTILDATKLPLRFVPFEGATLAQEQAMGGVCSTELKYRSLDSQGLPSHHTAIVRINVWHDGVSIVNVNASDTGASDTGLDAGDVVRFDFNVPTNEPLFGAHDIFDIVNGSWGTSAPQLAWINNGTTLLVKLLTSPASDNVVLLPNQTQFSVRSAVKLRRKGDPLSIPCDVTTAPMSGGFDMAICSPGAVFNWITGSCDACPKGTFWMSQGNGSGIGSSGVQCVSCPAGSFGNETAALSCFSCVPGRYMPPVNNSPPSTRTTCILASAGFHVSRYNSSAPEPCQVGTVAEQGGQTECNACPKHANCESGTSPPRSLAVALQGYFRLDNGSFAECRIPKTCLGAGMCADGAQNIKLGCYPCASGYTRFAGAIRDSRYCTKCPSFLHGLVTVGIVTLGTALFAIFLTRINITAARHTACLHPFMLKIALSHFQLMRAFGRFEEWELEFGYEGLAPFLHSLFAACFAWDGAMPAHLIPVDCILDEFNMTLKVRLWVTLAFWATLPFGFALTCLVLGLLIQKISELNSCIYAIICCIPCRKREGYSSEAEGGCESVFTASTSVKSIMGKENTVVGSPYEPRAAGIWRKTTLKTSCKEQVRRFFYDSSGLMIAALVLTYPTVLQQIMAFLRCDSLAGSNSESHLLMAPSLVCGKGDHVGLLVAAWFLLLSWGLGLPLLCGALLYHHRKHLNEFATHCRLGLLGAEYEPRYFFWDAVILLRRFAAIVAMLVAPAASRALQLSILLALGLVSLFVHTLHAPFDNRSGLLLDVMEAQALKIFCATCAVMLLGFSDVAHHGICFSLVLIVLLMHVLFILRILIFFVVQVQRSIADGLIDAEMHGKGPKPGQLIGPLRSLQERIFLLEANSRHQRGHVFYKEFHSELELAPGPAGNDVTDYERIFVAQGLAECVACVVTEQKFERISVQFLEFVTRLAFAGTWDRLQIMDGQVRKLAVKHGVQSKYDRPAHGGANWKNTPDLSAAEGMFHPVAFSLGLSASDFQLELIKISVAQRESLDLCFQEFLHQKGLLDSDPISVRDRLVCVVKDARKSLVGRKSKSSHHVALQITDLEEPAELMQITDLEEPAELTMIPNAAAIENVQDEQVDLEAVRRGCGYDLRDTSLPGGVEQTVMLRPNGTAEFEVPNVRNPSGAQQVEELTHLKQVNSEVLEFTKRAVQGVQCVYFKERTKERMMAMYCFDPGARYFILLTGDSIDTQELSCPIASVVRTFSVQDDGEVNFPQSVLELLQPEESSRLVMVAFRRADKVARFCILEESSQALDLFTKSLSVLSVCAERAQNQGDGGI